MTAVAVTELKNNFKIYAGKVSQGETVLVKRPKDEPNIIMMSENEYESMRRAMLYYTKMMEGIVAKEEDAEKITLYKRIKHKTLEERIAEMGVPLENTGEYDWGEPAEGEYW